MISSNPFMRQRTPQEIENASGNYSAQQTRLIIAKPNEGYRTSSRCGLHPLDGQARDHLGFAKQLSHTRTVFTSFVSFASRSA